MALTMNDLHTVNDFNAGEYCIEIKMNDQNQYFVIAKVKDSDHYIQTASGRTRYTRNLPYLVQEVCSICDNAKRISLNFGNKSFVLDNSTNNEE
ncbi:hypothetical protein R4576_18070 [Acinetobacter baumannii]|nr:hypothetical protein [Acinetobacter baumannii]